MAKPSSPRLFLVGDYIFYRDGWGTAPEAGPVLITGTGKKNGRPVVDFTSPAGTQKWAYESQCRMAVRARS